MRENNVFNVPFRRKRQGRTYYKKRLRILMSNKFRFVIRSSLKNFQASVIAYSTKGDKVLFTIGSKELTKLGWKGDNGNLPSAYLIGALAGKKALERGIKDAVLDLGYNKPTKGSRLYAALAGAIDTGLKIPFNPEILPPKDRISGEHIAKYAQYLEKDEQVYKKQFSNYIKKGINPADIVRHFNEIKVKIYG
ncbi:50S ribosomal protein L18 [Candidatus Woesearchaeota archaeon]|nr:50S ribosomal protein L18 [Candidatus Woesearchaeota archaeon]